MSPSASFVCLSWTPQAYDGCQYLCFLWINIVTDRYIANLVLRKDTFLISIKNLILIKLSFAAEAAQMKLEEKRFLCKINIGAESLSFMIMVENLMQFPRGVVALPTLNLVSASNNKR